VFGKKFRACGSPVLVSALTGEGIEELLRRMDAEMPIDPVVSLSIRLPLAEGRTLAMIHGAGTSHTLGNRGFPHAARCGSARLHCQAPAARRICGGEPFRA